jgi:hypothetical protein
LSNNLKIWKWHAGLWFSKALTLWLGYLTFSGVADTYLKGRIVTPYFWEKTDINYFIDLAGNIPGGALGSLFSVLTALFIIWFIIDTFFDTAIIGALSGSTGNGFMGNVRKVMLVRLIFWLPYALMVAAAVYAGIKLWTKFYAWWPIFAAGFVGAFLLFFLLKWLDMAKIGVVAEKKELKQALSDAGRLLFEDMKPTLTVNIVFAFLITVMVYLGIAVNIYFIPRSAAMLWLLWLVRQLIVILRQYFRYGFTGYWILFTRS